MKFLIKSNKTSINKTQKPDQNKIGFLVFFRQVGTPDDTPDSMTCLADEGVCQRVMYHLTKTTDLPLTPCEVINFTKYTPELNPLPFQLIS